MTVRSRILTFGLKGDLLNKMLREKKVFLLFLVPFPLWFLPPRFRYQDRAFLEALHAATQLLYLPESPACSQLTQLPMVHMMLTQHSLFLPTLLRSTEEEPADSPVRGTSSPHTPLQTHSFFSDSIKLAVHWS